MPNQEIGEWLKTQRPRCYICGLHSRLQVHHIDRRSHVPKGIRDAWCNLFVSCQRCHTTKLGAMPHREQLAYKLRFDPYSYSLEGWLRLRDPELKAPERVLQSEVDADYFHIFGVAP